MKMSNETKTNKQYEIEVKQLKNLVNDLYSFSYIDEMIDDLCKSRIDDKDDEMLIYALITKSRLNEVGIELDKNSRTQRDSKKFTQDKIDESNENLINGIGGI